MLIPLNFSKLSFDSSGYFLDLNAGGWLTTQSGHKGDWYDYGTSIAYEVSIENVVNSSSNDSIYLSGVTNTVSGYDAGTSTGVRCHLRCF